MIATLAKVPDAVSLVTKPIADAAVEPASAWSWTMPLIGGAVLLGVGLLCAGGWFAWTKRQASRDQRDLATHALAKRAGLSTPELQAIVDLVACVQGNHASGGESATTLGLIMSPHAAAELARTIEGDGVDRKQLGRALEKLGAPKALDLKARPKGARKPGKGSANRATPATGNEAIAMRARAILAAVNRAKAQGYFDAKPDAKPDAANASAKGVAAQPTAAQRPVQKPAQKPAQKSA